MNELDKMTSQLMDFEENASFRLNRTGNILYATTSDKLQQQTKDLFDGVTVLFAAMTKAIALWESEKDDGTTNSLFSHKVWTSLIEKTGFFAKVQQFQQMISTKKNEAEINTQVVQQLIPGIVTGGPSMTIAKSVLSLMDGKYESQKSKEEKDLAHVLFICEEIFNAPTVTVRIFNIHENEEMMKFEGKCGKVETRDRNFEMKADSYLYVSPEVISAYAGTFIEGSAEYNALVNQLLGNLRGDEVKPDDENQQQGGQVEEEEEVVEQDT